jgi:hypothetical protein
MKCSYSENDIAVYVEQDLNESRLREIASHLTECDACRRVEADLRESQLVFKSLRQDSVSGTALAEVRFRVLTEVEGLRSTTPWGRRVERWLWAGFRRGYALAGVAFLIVAGIGLWRASGVQDSRLPDRLPPAAAVPLERGTVEPSPLTPPHRERDGQRRGRPQAVARRESPEQAVPVPAAPEPRQVVVKLLTDDPNIVIYWLVDETGG